MEEVMEDTEEVVEEEGWMSSERDMRSWMRSWRSCQGGRP